jgi:hypothetical protein
VDDESLRVQVENIYAEADRDDPWVIGGTDPLTGEQVSVRVSREDVMRTLDGDD